MATYRIGDLFLLPNLLSAVRLPLALGFPFSAGHVSLALGLLALAAVSDVLDGWVARRLGQATSVGALVDGVADKVFAASVVGTLVATGLLSPGEAVLLATREAGEVPLACWLLFRERKRVLVNARKATGIGKTATVLEFVTVVAVIARWPVVPFLLAATASFGVAAAVGYWQRESGARAH